MRMETARPSNSRTSQPTRTSATARCGWRFPRGRASCIPWKDLAATVALLHPGSMAAVTTASESSDHEPGISTGLAGAAAAVGRRSGAPFRGVVLAELHVLALQARPVDRAADEVVLPLVCAALFRADQAQH